jgi:prepilin-type N-terminal cleavage/methylation domain-containing protein
MRKMALRKISRHKNAFTLIELMIVIAVLGILSSIAIPRMADLIRKAREASTLANLGVLRSALSIYYGDNGYLPNDQDDDLKSLTAGGKYLAKIPTADFFPYHPATNSVHTCDDPLHPGNDGYSGWVYGGYSIQSGLIFASCWHQMMSGAIWSEQ